MPSTVDKIFKAIKRDDPSVDDKSAWAIAYSTYNKKHEIVEGLAGNEESLWVLREEIVQLFKKVQYPTDNDIHSLALEIGVQHHELVREIYAFLSDLVREKANLPGAVQFSMNKQLSPSKDIFSEGIDLGPYAYMDKAAKK